MNAKIVALLAVAVVSLSSSAFAADRQDTRVSHVYAGRTVVPVVVKDAAVVRPYALTGRNDPVVKTVREEIRVGSRLVGYHIR